MSIYGIQGRARVMGVSVDKLGLYREWTATTGSVRLTLVRLATDSRSHTSSDTSLLHSVDMALILSSLGVGQTD
jgi:hypothetical protein